MEYHYHGFPYEDWSFIKEFAFIMKWTPLSLLFFISLTACTDDDGVIDPDDFSSWRNLTVADGLISDAVLTSYTDSNNTILSARNTKKTHIIDCEIFIYTLFIYLGKDKINLVIFFKYNLYY